MSAGKRYVLIFSFLLIYFVGKSDQSEKSERKARHFFPLLGYIHGYRSAQNFLQYPPYFFPQIIVLPSVTQQQAINIQKSYSDESYQENGGIFQYIQTAKLILNNDRENNSKTNKVTACENDLNDDKDLARQAVDVVSEKDNLKISSNITTINDNITSNNSAITNTASVGNSSTTVSKDTVELPTDFELPSDQKNNFTTNSNMTSENTVDPSSLTNVTDSNNLDAELNDNSNETYPNAWYNNSLVDKIRLTTLHDAESMSSDDGWHPEPSINSVSGFRPLAGLYYDGFLDKPVTKRSGFAPIKSKLDRNFLV